MKIIDKPKFYTYYNRLIFDSKAQNIPESISTNEITNALENAPIGIKGEKEPIGFFQNVSHRNATLYYGDVVVTDKAYAHYCKVERQLTTMKNSKLFKVISYVKKNTNE